MPHGRSGEAGGLGMLNEQPGLVFGGVQRQSKSMNRRRLDQDATGKQSQGIEVPAWPRILESLNADEKIDRRHLESGS